MWELVIVVWVILWKYCLVTKYFPFDLCYGPCLVILTIVSDTVSIAIMRQFTGLVTRLDRRGEEVVGLSSNIARFGCCPVPPSGCAMSSQLPYEPWLGGVGPWCGGGNVFVFAYIPSWWVGSTLGTYFGFWCRDNSLVIWVRCFWRFSRFGVVPPQIKPARYCQFNLLLRSGAVVNSDQPCDAWTRRSEERVQA